MCFFHNRQLAVWWCRWQCSVWWLSSAVQYQWPFLQPAGLWFLWIEFDLGIERNNVLIQAYNCYSEAGLTKFSVKLRTFRAVFSWESAQFIFLKMHNFRTGRDLLKIHRNFVFLNKLRTLWKKTAQIMKNAHFFNLSSYTNYKTGNWMRKLTLLNKMRNFSNNKLRTILKTAHFFIQLKTKTGFRLFKEGGRQKDSPPASRLLVDIHPMYVWSWTAILWIHLDGRRHLAVDSKSSTCNLFFN